MLKLQHERYEGNQREKSSGVRLCSCTGILLRQRTAIDVSVKEELKPSRERRVSWTNSWYGLNHVNIEAWGLNP